MLDEIRSLLTPQTQAPGSSSKTRKRGGGGTSDIPPMGVSKGTSHKTDISSGMSTPAKQDNRGPSPYDIPSNLVESFNKAATLKAKNKVKAGGTVKMSSEELLGYYLSTPLPTVDFTGACKGDV